MMVGRFLLWPDLADRVYQPVPTSGQTVPFNLVYILDSIASVSKHWLMHASLIFMELLSLKGKTYY